jgi:hypothetical protein
LKVVKQYSLFFLKKKKKGVNFAQNNASESFLNGFPYQKKKKKNSDNQLGLGCVVPRYVKSILEKRNPK